MLEHNVRILIAASGTGGHLFPALHIARAIKQVSTTATVEFIGSGRPLEEIIDRAGYKRHIISTVGVKHRGVGGFLQFLTTLPRALNQTWSLLSSFKPDVVVGVGGYVSFLPITLAFFRRIPTWIHEAEIRPGLANWVLSLYASRVSTAFPNTKMLRAGNVIYTGHPVREELRTIKREATHGHTPRNVLVTGGSQGAKALDGAMLGLVDLIKEKKLNVCHQCRADHVDYVRQRYQELQAEAVVVPFIQDMAEAYQWSDIIISRAGAGSVMEIGVVNRPTIFVPYPHAQGNHQLYNARTLVDQGKALLVEEGENFDGRLREALGKLLNAKFYYEMRSRAYEERSLEAANVIARGCLNLVYHRNTEAQK